MSALLSPTDLAAMIPQPKILDCSYGSIDTFAAYERAHIADAQYFDIDAVADPFSKYAHTMPKPELFARAVSAMGIGNDDTVVVYDQTGVSFAAARVWWMFRVMGHENVKVMNGGLPAWMAAGLPVQSGPVPAPAPRAFEARFNGELLRHYEDIENSSDTVLDARGTERFHMKMRGTDGDIVPAHIPGSISVPYAQLLDATGALVDTDTCASILFPHIATGSRMTVTCGSGVTACVLALGFFEAGLKDVAVYDGSWTEWSDKNGLR